jgi:hypothetical protein
MFINCICIVIIVCNESFIAYIHLCAVFCLNVVHYFDDVCYFSLCLIAVPLTQGKNEFSVKI